MNGVYLIIGGNLGDREINIRKCRKYINKVLGKIVTMSAIYETAAWGNTNLPSYLNQVLYVHTRNNIEDTLEICLQIEKNMGRERLKKWDSRVIDIDILFFNKEIVQKDNLKVPHPHLDKRKFVLIPLCELAPNMQHPISGKSLKRMLKECADTLKVIWYQAS